MGEYEVDGQSCWFVEQERMTKGVEENEFLDVGTEQESYMYGTTFTSVRDVMAENKLCVIDCRPEVCNAPFCVLLYVYHVVVGKPCYIQGDYIFVNIAVLQRQHLIV